MPSSSVQTNVELPLIDISQFPYDEPGLSNLQKHPWLAAVRKGCEEYGFFSVVNHGIPNHLLEDMESVIHELCAMPAEAKDRSATSNRIRSYIRMPGSDSFSISKLPESNSVQELCDKIWPEKGNPRLCKTLQTYISCMEELTRKISKIVIASLGLQVETLYHSDFKNCTGSLRINHFKAEGKSIEQEILYPHTDLNCFTILYQDIEGGLQILSKEGEWLNVKPQCHSFVVNVGDSLKAWSNGRYRSVEHRVVCKGWADRYSVPYFVSFSDDKEICTPTELVNDEHPQRYRSFFYTQLEDGFLNSIEFKEKQNAAKFLERYAGI